ncbi:M4 family metallopeptidase [Bacillus cereus group sp. MYBK223-2]|uniref:M4 family metallopeptidase n=1 Tax=unclassified Bacillus cereus group TaxID=2750818 RepID=UPI003F79C006
MYRNPSYVSAFVPTYILANMAKARIEQEQTFMIDTPQIFLHNDKPSDVGIGDRYIYDCKDTPCNQPTLVRFEGEPPTNDVIVDHVYDYIGICREYLKVVLKWQPRNPPNYDAEYLVYVNQGTKYNNSGSMSGDFFFGSGDGENFINFGLSKDAIGHEMGHEIASRVGISFLRSAEPATIAEHYGDVFSVAIKQHVTGQTEGEMDWLIGSDIMTPKLSGNALRSMKAPGTAYDNDVMGKDPQFDHIRNFYDGSRDDFGKYINTGILNKAFYLVAMGIGINMAVQIWYYALQRLWEAVNLNDFADVISLSSQILAKKGEVSKEAPQIVRSAFKEVGLF